MISKTYSDGYSVSFFYKWTRKEHMKIINFFLNGVTYFLLHQLIQFHILYKKILIYLFSKIISLKNILT